MTRLTYILISFLFFITLSCRYLNINKGLADEAIVASVGDVYLYKSDLSHLFFNEKSSQDSLILVNSYIETWARKQLLIQKAILNLSDDKQDELNKMITNYREDLYSNTYKDALVSQNLDSAIAAKSISDFYSKNQSVFMLKENIFRVKIYRFRTKGVSLSKIKRQFFKYSIQELDSIYEDDLNFNEAQLSDSLWINFNEFANWNSLFNKNINKKSLKKGFYKEIKNKEFTYFIHVIDEKKRGEIAPQKQVKPVIKQMLLHQKKLEYINKLDSRLIEDAINNKTFKRY